MKSKIFWIFFGIALAGLCIRRLFPDANRLKRIDGMIHHPVYGIYPEKVEFKQGMDLKPGQTAVFVLKSSVPAAGFGTAVDSFIDASGEGGK